jgi:hypothetical protein
MTRITYKILQQKAAECSDYLKIIKIAGGGYAVEIMCKEPPLKGRVKRRIYAGSTGEVAAFLYGISNHWYSINNEEL